MLDKTKFRYPQGPLHSRSPEPSRRQFNTTQLPTHGNQHKPFKFPTRTLSTLSLLSSPIRSWRNRNPIHDHHHPLHRTVRDVPQRLRPTEAIVPVASVAPRGPGLGTPTRVSPLPRRRQEPQLQPFGSQPAAVRRLLSMVFHGRNGRTVECSSVLLVFPQPRTRGSRCPCRSITWVNHCSLYILRKKLCFVVCIVYLCMYLESMYFIFFEGN